MIVVPLWQFASCPNCPSRRTSQGVLLWLARKFAAFQMSCTHGSVFPALKLVRATLQETGGLCVQKAQTCLHNPEPMSVAELKVCVHVSTVPTFFSFVASSLTSCVACRRLQRSSKNLCLSACSDRSFGMVKAALKRYTTPHTDHQEDLASGVPLCSEQLTMHCSGRERRHGF